MARKQDLGLSKGSQNSVHSLSGVTSDIRVTLRQTFTGDDCLRAGVSYQHVNNQFSRRLSHWPMTRTKGLGKKEHITEVFETLGTWLLDWIRI